MIKYMKLKAPRSNRSFLIGKHKGVPGRHYEILDGRTGRPVANLMEVARLFKVKVDRPHANTHDHMRALMKRAV